MRLNYLIIPDSYRDVDAMGTDILVTSPLFVNTQTNNALINAKESEGTHRRWYDARITAACPCLAMVKAPIKQSNDDRNRNRMVRKKK